MKYEHIMIDIESLSLKTNAHILSIGAVMFGKELGAEFHTSINMGDPNQKSRDIDGDTLSWWFRQGLEARKLLDECSLQTKTLTEALFGLAQFCNQHRPRHFWAQGEFDYRVLKNAYDQFNLEPPWMYNEVRDSRTLMAIAPQWPDIPTDPDFVQHNALHDAKRQARTTMAIISQIEHNQHRLEGLDK